MAVKRGWVDALVVERLIPGFRAAYPWRDKVYVEANTYAQTVKVRMGEHDQVVDDPMGIVTWELP